LKKIIAWISEHGFVLMMSGFALAVAGVLVYWRTRYSGSYVPQVAFGVTIAGFALYVIGRIFVATRRNRTRSSITETKE